MKAILRFDLNDETDRYNFDCANKATTARSVIADVDNYCRNILKYGNDDVTLESALQAIRDICHSINYEDDL